MLLSHGIFQVNRSLQAILASQTSNVSFFLNMTSEERDFLDEHSANLTSLMRKVTHKCSSMILSCHWHGKKVNCSRIFQVSGEKIVEGETFLARIR